MLFAQKNGAKFVCFGGVIEAKLVCGGEILRDSTAKVTEYQKMKYDVIQVKI